MWLVVQGKNLAAGTPLLRMHGKQRPPPHSGPVPSLSPRPWLVLAPPFFFAPFSSHAAPLVGGCCCFGKTHTHTHTQTTKTQMWIRNQALLFTPVSCLLVTLGWQYFLHPRHILRTGRASSEGVAIVARHALFFGGLCKGLTPSAALAAYMAYNTVAAAYIFTQVLAACCLLLACRCFCCCCCCCCRRCCCLLVAAAAAAAAAARQGGSGGRGQRRRYVVNF